MTAFKIGKFVRKKIDEQDYLLVKMKGKPTAKIVREIKKRLNQVVFDFMNPNDSLE